jgi:uncharacterized protein involved in exopolysaccharide biosynthesis/Mrp family chromosome partitioning ATPase
MRSAENEQIVALLRHVVERRKRLLFACLALTLLAAAAYNRFATPEYEATTSIVLDEAAAPVGTSPYERAYSDEMRIANRLAEIASYSLAEAVADSLPATMRQRIRSWDKAPAGSRDDRRIVSTWIQESIVAQSLPGSNIVRISVRTRDPDVCTVVANTLTDVLAERGRRAKIEETGGARQFIASQLERYEAELARTEQQLMEFKRRNALTSFDDEAREVLRRSTEAEVQYNAAVANRRATIDRLSSVERELESEKRDLVPKVVDATAPAAIRLKQKLVDLQVEYQDLRVQGYPSNHPKLVQLEHDITETKENLTTEAQKLARGEVSIDPISRIDKYVTDAVGLRMEVESLGAQETALRRVIEGYNSRLAGLPSKEYELVRMTRERDVNQRIYTMLQEKLQQARISEAEQLPDIRTIDRALRPLGPTKPRKAANLALGGLLGLVLGLGLAIGREILGSGVDSSQAFEKTARMRVLATIPRVEHLQPDGSPVAVATDRREWRRIQRALVAYNDRTGGVAESYRILRTNLQFAGFGEQIRTLVVTSMMPGEGKTTSVANLAITMAGLGQPTLVVDGEIRKPGMHAIFGVQLQPGLTELLRQQTNGDGEGNGGREASGGAEPKRGHRKSDDRHGPRARWREAALVESASREQGTVFDPDGNPLATTDEHHPLLTAPNGILQPTFVPHLTVVASGAAGFEAAQSLSIDAQRLRTFLDAMRTRYRYVLIDAPPMMLVHDVALLSSLVDGVLMIVDSRALDKDMLADCKQKLANARANVVGVVLNRVEPVGAYRSNSYYRT